MLIDVPVQQRRQHDGVAEAADGEQLGRTLQHGDDDGLQCGHARFLADAD